MALSQSRYHLRDESLDSRLFTLALRVLAGRYFRSSPSSLDLSPRTWPYLFFRVLPSRLSNPQSLGAAGLTPRPRLLRPGRRRPRSFAFLVRPNSSLVQQLFASPNPSLLDRHARFRTPCAELLATRHAAHLFHRLLVLRCRRSGFFRLSV